MRTFDELIAAYPAEVQALSRSARAFVLELLPDAEQHVDTFGPYIHYGFGPGDKGTVCYLTVSKNGVKLGLAGGARLADPKGLLEGSGKAHRHVVLETTSDLRKPGLEQLVRAALRAWQTENRSNRSGVDVGGLTGRTAMAGIERTATQAAQRVKAAAAAARSAGETLAAQVVDKKTVKRAKKTVARAGSKLKAMATKVTDKVTGRAKKRKRVKVAAAVAGAAAVAAAAGIGIARRRKR